MKYHFALYVALLCPSWSWSSNHAGSTHHTRGHSKAGTNPETGAKIEGQEQHAAIPKGRVAFGFAAGTTGGGSLPPQVPKDIRELASWLADKVPRVILLDKTYDFTSENGTGAGCKPWPQGCKNGNHVQDAVDFNHWCSKDYPKVQVKFDKGPMDPLKVESNKSLLGLKDKGVIKGKGLSLHGSKNIIIQNIHITGLNPHLVWGGDGLMLYGATQVWVDHCTFSLIGRQMVVTAFDNTKGITLSNNHFDGRTPWSAGCNNRHYWTVLVSGASDQVTMANNCLDSTSGRSPKVFGDGALNAIVHYYNNLHTNTIGECFEINPGGVILAEGNAFVNMQIVNPGDVDTSSGGSSYVPFKEKDAQACQKYLGRACVTNVIMKSAPFKFRLDLSALEAFKKILSVSQAHPLPAASIIKGVPGGCGIGHL